MFVYLRNKLIFINIFFDSPIHDRKINSIPANKSNLIVKNQTEEKIDDASKKNCFYDINPKDQLKNYRFLFFNENDLEEEKELLKLFHMEENTLNRSCIYFI